MELEEISLRPHAKLSRLLYGIKPSKGTLQAKSCFPEYCCVFCYYFTVCPSCTSIVVEIANGAIKFWDYHTKMLLSWKDYCTENEKLKRKELEAVVEEQQRKVLELSSQSSRMNQLENNILTLKKALELSENSFSEAERYVK